MCHKRKERKKEGRREKRPGLCGEQEIERIVEAGKHGRAVYRMRIDKIETARQKHTTGLGTSSGDNDRKKAVHTLWRCDFRHSSQRTWDESAEVVVLKKGR